MAAVAAISTEKEATGTAANDNTSASDLSIVVEFS
jgi:hypothetical protein